MPVAMIRLDELKKFAPKAKPDYVRAFLDGETYLREAGILDTELTLCHFMAQVGAETNGLQVLRENLNYTSVGAIRRAWSARSRKHSDEWIKMNLIRNPVALGQWAYGGREANARAPSRDGYNFRGGGQLQTTHRRAVTHFCTKLGIPVDDTILDDCLATLRFACFEWKESGCGPYAARNDLLSVSKIINTGSAKSGVMPNGIEHRKHWLKQSWAVWGDGRAAVPEVADVTEQTLREKGSETISMTDLVKTGGAVGAAISAASGAAKESGLTDIPPSVSTPDALESLRKLTESTDAISTIVNSLKGFFELALSNIWVLGLVLGLGGYVLARWIADRRVHDARLGLNTARVG